MKGDNKRNDKKIFEEIKKNLLEMKAELLKEITETVRAESDSSETTTLGDLFDQAGTERDRELELLLSDRDREKLMEIENALSRIEDGTYGICEECGKRINMERLKIMPFARYCVECQSKVEKEEEEQKLTSETNIYRKLIYTEPEEES